LGGVTRKTQKKCEKKYRVLETETYCRILRVSESYKIWAFKDANNFEVPVS